MPDVMNTDIRVSTLGPAGIYNFSFDHASGWTWHGSQYAWSGVSTQVIIHTYWLAGFMIGSATVTDNFESEYDGHLTPTGTGGTPPIVKPWHAYAWDHSIDVITDPVYVSAHNGNELTREGPTTATLIACWPPTRVSLPSWSTSSTGLAFSPNPGGTTTVTNNSVATGQPVTVTAQATQQAPFSGPLSATATVNVMDVDIAASTVAEKNETTTAVLVPVLAETATSGGVPVSLSVAPIMDGTAKLEKSSSSFDVYGAATFSASSALLCGTQTTATFASASSIPPTVYLKGVTASTSTASSDTLTLSFTPSAQTGGSTPSPFKDTLKCNIVKVNLSKSPVYICAKTQWQNNQIGISDHECIITISTTPAGYENNVNLTIKSISPSGDGQGTLTKASNSTWTYQAVEESASDKFPGNDNPSERIWNVQIEDTLSGEKISSSIYSVFRYCVVCKSNNSLALDYEKWKYASFISSQSLTEGTYDSGLTAYGCTQTYSGSVTYGDPAFRSENVLLSTIGHEDVHVDQGQLIRYSGAIDRGLYEAQVALGNYPSPPTHPPIGSIGKGWGRMEFEAREWELNHKSDTGIDNDEEFLGYVNEEDSFYLWIFNNCY